MLTSLNLMSTRVGGEFQLDSEQDSAAKWQTGAKLVLRNTEVDSLQDSPNAWPNTLELDGFNYSRLGGTDADDTGNMATRKIAWLKKWLERQKKYSPQPYEQLAKILRKAGYKDKATKILYEGKKREHRETTRRLSPSWWWLTFQWLFIGYGYRNFQVIIWILALWGSGMLILHVYGQDAAHNMKYWGLAYSIDMLLPIIELHKPHYEIILDGFVRGYFYIQKILGYVLALFLIAGLSGLTKR